MIDPEHTDIRNMGSLISSFDHVDEGVLVDSIAPKNLDQVLEKLMRTPRRKSP
jgi:hypothetical protein